MKIDTSVEHITMLLNNMELDQTYMKEPVHYIPVFEKIVEGLKPVAKDKNLNAQDFSVAMMLYAIEVIFLYAPKKNIALYTILDMLKTKLDMVSFEEKKDVDGEA
tara:strand:- start:47 stop:361 length:315 start_codon:yes stop_codon:yes gene_type:complete